MSLTTIDLGLRELLADQKRRQAFFRTITQDDIAAHIRSLRKARGLTQAKLAELAGMKQSAVSRIEQAEYASWTWGTLGKVAEALDARWCITLEPCEYAVEEFLRIDDAQNASLPTEDKRKPQWGIERGNPITFKGPNPSKNSIRVQ
jgi:transcriptional regulator with XRE-family HTH domain